MEPRQERPSGPDDSREAARAPEGKMQRILSELEGLLADLRTWIDLRLDLAILKLEERVSELQNNIALGLTLAFVAFFAVLFTLTTAAVGLGWLLGHVFWGFLAVSVALILIVIGLRAARPEFVPRPDLLQSMRGKDARAKSEGAPDDDGPGTAPTDGGEPVSQDPSS